MDKKNPTVQIVGNRFTNIANSNRVHEEELLPYLLDNLIVPKDNEEHPLFAVSDNHIDCFLKGYAIIPKDVFYKILEKAGIEPEDFLVPVKEELKV